MPSDDESYWDFGAGVGGSGIGTKEGREILRRAEAGEADADADADADKGDGKEKGRASWRDMPIVSFEGRSRSTYMSWDPNANSRIRGEFLPQCHHQQQCHTVRFPPSAQLIHLITYLPTYPLAFTMY